MHPRKQYPRGTLVWRSSHAIPEAYGYARACWHLAQLHRDMPAGLIDVQETIEHVAACDAALFAYWRGAICGYLLPPARED